MAVNKYKTYQQNSVNTATGGELTLMLYNGCIKFIKQAIKDVDANQYQAKNTNLQKAQNIIRELMITLDPNVEISVQMMPLYEFIQHKLQQGNIQHSNEQLEEALSMVTEFRDTWKEVLLKSRQKQYAKGAGV